MCIIRYMAGTLCMYIVQFICIEYICMSLKYCTDMYDLLHKLSITDYYLHFSHIKNVHMHIAYDLGNS